MDLKELFRVIWKGKLTVVLTSILFLIISTCFALLVQEWWSSSAKIAEAQPQDLASYEQQVRQFQPVFNLYQDDGTVLLSKELNVLVDSKVLFERFVNTFNASNNKRTFLDNNDEFQDFKNSLSNNTSPMTDDAIRVLYSEWFERIEASITDVRDQNAPYVISFQTMTQESSFNLLESYISVTEAKVHQDAFNNLQAIVNGKRNELIHQKKILETQAVNELLVETERTKYAMDIARAAGVNNPIQTGNDKELFGIELGSKGLEAKVQALESIKNLGVIEPRLQQIDAKLNMLNNLKINRDVEFQTFRYIENVEQPTTRDKPKRALIIILGTFFGCILGVVIVLARCLFKAKS
ncbi:Chain length determinant protein [Vibrio coralliirubri]|nr:Chain length determinant protein [Vibrio coralliirubri]